jgi:hypothetical protein
VHGHQLDRGDAQRGEVVDHRGVAEPGVGPADLVGDVGVGLGQPLDVGLVDDRVVVGATRQSVVLPVEVGVGDHRLHRVRRGVVGVAPGLVAEGVGEQRLVPVDLPLDGLGVGVEQQLGRVAAVPLGRLVGPVDAEAVALARPDPGQVRVPDERVALGDLHPRLLAVGVEQAQLDAVGDLGEKREVGAGTVVRRAQRVRTSGPDLHAGEVTYR